MSAHSHTHKHHAQQLLEAIIIYCLINDHSASFKAWQYKRKNTLSEGMGGAQKPCPS